MFTYNSKQAEIIKVYCISPWIHCLENRNSSEALASFHIDEAVSRVLSLCRLTKSLLSPVKWVLYFYFIDEKNEVKSYLSCLASKYKAGVWEQAVCWHKPVFRNTPFLTQVLNCVATVGLVLGIAEVNQEPMAIPSVCLSAGVPGLTSFDNYTFMDFISTINIVSSVHQCQ